MNFITPLLFVFYLQVMPPPPPTMHGGGDLQAGFSTSDSNGNSTFNNNTFLPDFLYFFFIYLPNNSWDLNDLNQALNGGQALPGGFSGYEDIVLGISQNYLTALEVAEWNALINYAVAFGKDIDQICNLARQDDPNGVTAAETSCPDEVPIPSELILFNILSFLLFCYYFKREEFSNLNFFKKQRE
jgi:hypothetical protein